MNTSDTMRRQILGDLKAVLSKGDGDGARKKVVTDRLLSRARHIIPKRGQEKGTVAIDRFQAEAEQVHATVARVSGMDQVPQAVADYLAGQNMPASIKMTPDPRLQSAPWSDTVLQVSEGTAHSDDTAGISHAFGAVAETGTLVFLSSSENPTTVNFLPPAHIAVVRARDIQANYEATWDRLRDERTGAEGPQDGSSDRFMPRTVNWITGPSRTADIELTLFLGIHGPKNLHILIVDEDDGD